MKKKTPKGLVVFAIILGLSALSSVRFLFVQDSYAICIGQMLSGTSFKIYYLFLSILNIVIAVGIIKLKRWAYISFVFLTIYYILTSVINILITQQETLVKAGWNLSENGAKSFYFIQGACISLSLAMFFWLYIYRKNFKSNLK